jgi:hypothetical protein
MFVPRFAAMLAVSLQLIAKEIGKLAANICYDDECINYNLPIRVFI